jgi:hypothetical protein
MSVQPANVRRSVTVPFGHLVLRLVELDCGTRGWSLRIDGFGSDALTVVNGSLDGGDLAALTADFETGLSALRQFGARTGKTGKGAACP